MSVGRCFRIGDSDTWVASIPLSQDDAPEDETRSPMAVHFVIDNSGSMGAATEQAKIVFSDLVDKAATAPCSLTLFEHRATLQSEDINTTNQMLELPPLHQGGTNIPSGIQTAMECIARRERARGGAGSHQKTHHVLILLTDGYHNSGSPPEVEFPNLGNLYKQIIPGVQLSVIVVGITRNSSTSMGMLLKTSLETVPLSSDEVQNIYFATDQGEMKQVLGKLVKELERVSFGQVHTVSHPRRCIVSGFGLEPTDNLTVRTVPQKDKSISILIRSKQAPDHLVLDGSRVNLVDGNDYGSDDVPYELIAAAIASQIDKIRIQRVASASPEIVRSAVCQLNTLIDALEKELAAKNSSNEITLSKARGSERLKQHRAMVRTTYLAKALRNELADVANFSAAGSEEQAAFLTGRQSKYANKALRRAAARSGGEIVLDPTKELQKAHDEITSDAFVEDLAVQLCQDTIGHLARLSKEQLAQLAKHVHATSCDHAFLLSAVVGSGVIEAFQKETKCEAKSSTLLWVEKLLKVNTLTFEKACQSLPTEVQDFIHSGTLAAYLNAVFFGGRKSYLSLSSPWEHVAEWRDVQKCNETFSSQWEMLLYLGGVACPITVERCAAAQMNPFQLTIRQIHTTVIDTASLCCANQSDIKTYGPEGGQAIQDALPLIDPSCPRACRKIASSTLLGATFTSVVVSRDLHMYSGSSMKVALLANSLFCALQPEPKNRSKADVVADIRRAFGDHDVYQCPKCRFGPVDHEGCSDLTAHHGEEDSDGGGIASNACPLCEWFCEDLDEWHPWDGNVHESLIQEKCSTQADGDKPLLLQAKIDLALRIVYSFRKQFFQGDNTVKEFYNGLAKRLSEWDTNISTRDGIDGLSQILIALMACDDDALDESSIKSAFAPPVALAILNEACAREARKKFRKLSGGSEAEARELAAKHVTQMLAISAESAPTTTDTLLEPEPPRADMEQQCSKDYAFDFQSSEEHEDIVWAKEIAANWCQALAVAQQLRACIAGRGGGWAKLERDMETSLDNYQDVVQDLQSQEQPSWTKMCDVELQHSHRTLLTMAVQAYLHNKGTTEEDLQDVRDADTLACAARDMRMKIYEGRVREKMAQWSNQGMQLAFFEARACDIGQYEHMLGGRHVHGLNKEMFWGLWQAAVADGHDGAKVQAFLDTANEGFLQAHAPKGGQLVAKKQKKRRRREIKK